MDRSRFRFWSFMIMTRRKFIENEEGSLISFFVPISLMFGFVLILHQLPKLGMLEASSPLLEPVFAVWFIFIGILFSVCFFMRQFVVLFIAVMLSFLGTVAIYIMYVI